LRGSAASVAVIVFIHLRIKERMRVRPLIVHFSRAVYAMNWFNIAPGLYYISREFHVGIAQLGILTTAFYAGVAIFQLPAGFLAAKFGNRIVGGFGIVILGISTLLSGYSPSLPILDILRFFGGLGSAFFFSPAIATLKEVVDPSSYGFHINIYNGSFNIGAGLGVIIWAILDLHMGWRNAFTVAGIVTLLVAFLYIFGLRGTREFTDTGRNLLSNISRLIRSKPIWILSIAAMSTMIAEIVVGQLSIYYLRDHFQFSEMDAMTADSLFLLVGFVGGILGAALTKRYGLGVRYFAMINIVLSVLVFPFAVLNSVVGIYIISIVLGLLTVQGFSLLYVIIGTMQQNKTLLAFSLALVNFIQQLFGSIWPTVFGFIHNISNYFTAWIFLGFVGLVFIPLLRLYRKGTAII